MTDKAAANATPSMAFQVGAQYIQDLSFESPNPLKYFTSTEDKPNIDVSVDVQADPVGDKAFEVMLGTTVKATVKGETVFLLELDYRGLFTFEAEMKPEDLRPILLIECPRFLFPFARQIIAETTAQGGFPPLSLAPIDFAALYRQQADQAASQVVEEEKEAAKVH